MAQTVKAIPAGYHSVTPHLIYKGAADAIEFYKKAFGAVEIMRMADPMGGLGMRKSELVIRTSCSPTKIRI